MIQWDTSALVKCYAALEKGHARARNLLLRERGHKGSVLLWPEAVSGIVRKLSTDRRVRESLLALLKGHLKHFDLLPVDQAQLELAVKLICKHRLRSDTSGPTSDTSTDSVSPADCLEEHKCKTMKLKRLRVTSHFLMPFLLTGLN